MTTDTQEARLYRLTEITPPHPVLAPGDYLITASGQKMMVRLDAPTTPTELADMVEAMEQAARGG
jgi:hypothetical protein